MKIARSTRTNLTRGGRNCTDSASQKLAPTLTPRPRDVRRDVGGHTKRQRGDRERTGDFRERERESSPDWRIGIGISVHWVQFAYINNKCILYTYNYYIVYNYLLYAGYHQATKNLAKQSLHKQKSAASFSLSLSVSSCLLSYLFSPFLLYFCFYFFTFEENLLTIAIEFFLLLLFVFLFWFFYFFSFLLSFVLRFI